MPRRILSAISAIAGLMIPLVGCQPLPTGRVSVSSERDRAIAALEELHAQIEVGITADEYRRALGAVAGTVRAVPADNPDYAKIQEVLQVHLLAQDFWSCEFEESYGGWTNCRNVKLGSALTKIPEMQQEIERQMPNWDASTPAEGLDPDAVLQMLWIVAQDKQDKLLSVGTSPQKEQSP